MKKFFCTFAGAMATLITAAQMPTPHWIKQLSGTHRVSAMDVTVDNAGNVYTCGRFTLTADFDPHPTNTYNLVSAGDDDGFITKMDANGNLLWAYSLGKDFIDNCTQIEVDNAGNVLIIGETELNVDFDFGPGLYPLVQGAYILKIDPNGAFIWAKSLGFYPNVNSLALDGSGNVYIAGDFTNGADFDPDSSAVYNVSSAGNADAFLLKLNANGNFAWVRTFGSTFNDRCYGVAVDAQGNVGVTGRFEGTVDFDSDSVATAELNGPSGDAFVAKYSADGSLIWAKGFGSPFSDSGSRLRFDSDGNVYAMGIFQGDADLDPGPATYPVSSNGSFDAYVSKFNADGELVWARHLGNEISNQPSDIALDYNQRIYVIGAFADTMDFDPSGAGAYPMVSQAGNDAFVLQLDNDGNFLDVNAYGGPDFQQTYGIGTNGNNVVLTGVFWDDTDFGNNNIFTVTGELNSFVLKFGDSTTTAIAATALADRALFPNPTSGLVRVNVEETGALLEVFNALGALVETIFADKSIADINLSQQPVGLYLIKATVNDRIVATHKVVKQ